MYEGYTLVALLLAGAIVLFIAEALLPTHGILGLAAVGLVLLSVFVCSKHNPWAGLGLMVAVACATPFVWTAFIKIWPKTYVGKRLILPDLDSKPHDSGLRVGQAGVTVSELRPMGLCEFGGVRIEAMSEQGVVPTGTRVKVIALNNNRPTVRVA